MLKYKAEDKISPYIVTLGKYFSGNIGNLKFYQIIQKLVEILYKFYGKKVLLLVD